MLEELTPDAIEALLAELPNMPLDEKESLLNELESLEKKREIKACREDFLAFCAYILVPYTHLTLPTILRLYVSRYDRELRIKTLDRLS